MLAQIGKSIYFFFQNSPQTSFSNTSCFRVQIKWYQTQRLGIQSVMIRLTLWNLERAFKYDCCAEPPKGQQLSCAKELSQIMAGWCVPVDSSLCLDKRNNKSFWLQAASRLLSLFSSLPSSEHLCFAASQHIYLLLNNQRLNVPLLWC